MAKIYVSSSGDDIRFWTENDQANSARISSVPGPINSMDWSEDGLQMIACSNDNLPISVISIANSIKNGPSVITNVLSQLPGHASVAAFGHDSGTSYAAVGHDGSRIAIVNTRTLEIVKTLPQMDGKRNIMSLCFDTSDTRLAAADEAGNIQVYNVIQAILSKPLSLGDCAIARQVKFSPHKKGLLGSAFDSGTIALWDVFKSQKIHSFDRAHSMPVTGICFSPLNDMLLLSVGLDKQMCCLDLRKNLVVKSIQTDSAICSLDFHFDGWAVGVGTTRGRLLIYDLRQPNRPFREIAAHQTSVSNVKFASKSCLLTTAHISPKNNNSPVSTKLVKPSASSTAISPLSSNENTRSNLNVNSTNDGLSSFYMRAPDTVSRFGEIEMNQKARILEAQRLLSQTPLSSGAAYDQQLNEIENIRSQSVDVGNARSRMDDTFRANSVVVGNLSPISTRGASITRSQFNVPNAINRPLPSAASTPFHPPATSKSLLAGNSLSTISTLPSRLPIESVRPDSTASFISASSNVGPLASQNAEDSWSPSPEPCANTTIKETGCNVYTQTLVIGDFPPCESHQDATTQTDSADSISVSLSDYVNALNERLDPIDEKVKRLNARFISVICDQTAELRQLMQEHLSPNVALMAEIDRLKKENEDLRQTVVAYDARLFNSTLRL